MSNQFEPLDSETAVSIEGSRIVVSERMFKSEDFIEACLRRLDIRDETRDWVDGEVDCEILEPGSPKWVKGKLRISINLEFCPSEE
jgi:hypothetical protein